MGASRREERELEADLAAQELGPQEVLTRTTATGWLRAVHPGHGEAVTYVPGEALPQWVVDLLPGGVPDEDDDRVLVLGGPPPDDAGDDR